MAIATRIRQTLEDPALRAILVNGAAALVIKVLSAGLSFAMFVLIANAMPPDEYGKFAFGFSLAITLSTIAGLGLGTAVLRFVPQYEAQKSPALLRGFFRFATQLSIAVPLLAGVVLAGVAYGVHVVWPQHGVGYLYATALFIPVMAISEFLANALRAHGLTIASMAPRDVFWRAIIAGIALAAIVGGYAVSGGAMVMLCAGALALILAGQVLYGRRLLQPLLARAANATDYRLWIKTFIPMWGAASVFALVQQFDVVILGLFLSPQEAGPYFAALRTAGMLGLLLVAGNMISAPLIARYHHAGDREMLQKIVRLLTAGIAIPTILGLGLLSLIGGWLLSWFDASFVAAYPLLIILGIGFTFDAVAGPTGYMLQMVGKEAAYLRIMGSAYALTLVLQCLLIPYFGPYGAAIPNAFGLIMANIYIIKTVRKELGVDPSLIGLFRPYKPSSPVS